MASPQVRIWDLLIIGSAPHAKNFAQVPSDDHIFLDNIPAPPPTRGATGEESHIAAPVLVSQAECASNVLILVILTIFTLIEKHVMKLKDADQRNMCVEPLCLCPSVALFSLRHTCRSALQATPRYTTPHHATTRHTTPRQPTPRHATPRHATPRQTTPNHMALRIPAGVG